MGYSTFLLFARSPRVYDPLTPKMPKYRWKKRALAKKEKPSR